MTNKFCIGCEKELSEYSATNEDGTGDIVWICYNENCDRWGLLTVVYIDDSPLN